MKRDHAIVIGSGIAGLIMAQVLQQYFEKVTLIESDVEPPENQVRKGAPQGSQPHVLSIRGRRILFKLFPGLDEEFNRNDVPHVTIPMGTRRLGTFVDWEPRYKTRLYMRMCTRPFLETCLRRRVAARANVKFMYSANAAGLLMDQENRRVMGITFRRSGREESEELRADLVVDAAGRRSPLVKWLADANLTPPPETRVLAEEWYASAMFRLRATPRDWKVAYVPKAVPQRARERGAFIAAVEGGLHIATLIGDRGTKPPRSMDQFLEYARGVEGGAIYPELATGAPLTSIAYFSGFDNVCMRVDKCKDWPRGLLAVGDSFCRFNPVHFQGMTCAALAGHILGKVVGAEVERAANDGAEYPGGWEREFYDRLFQVLENPWALATRESLLKSPTSTDRPMGLAKQFRKLRRAINEFMFTMVYRAMFMDRGIHYAVVQAQHMITPMSSLTEPHILLRALFVQMVNPILRILRQEPEEADMTLPIAIVDESTGTGTGTENKEAG